MPKKLTPKQERFARAIATGEAKTQVEAYEIAYDVDKTKKSVRYREASRLAGNPDIATRVQALRIAMAIPTAEEHIGRLDHLSARAEEAEQFSAAVKAEEMIGRAAGHYVERSISEHVHRVADTDLLQSLLDALNSDSSMLNAVLEMALSKPELRDKAQLMLSKPETEQ